MRPQPSVQKITKHLASSLRRINVSILIPSTAEAIFLKVFFMFFIARLVLIYVLITKFRLANSLLILDGFSESLRCQNKSSELNMYLHCTQLPALGINDAAVISLYSSGGERRFLLPCSL